MTLKKKKEFFDLLRIWIHAFEVLIFSCVWNDSSLLVTQNINKSVMKIEKSVVKIAKLFPNPLPLITSVQFSSVNQLCPTLCDPVNCSMPSIPVRHKLPEFTQTPAHRVGDALEPISSSVIPFSSCTQSFPAAGTFPMSQLFAWGGQSNGVSASASVLPMNTQD